MTKDLTHEEMLEIAEEREQLGEYAIKISKEMAKIMNIKLGNIEPVNLIRVYCSLYALVGGDAELMIHWLNTENKHLNFIPVKKLNDTSSIKKIINYLDGLLHH
jgi:hypothetical protein